MKKKLPPGGSDDLNERRSGYLTQIARTATVSGNPSTSVLWEAKRQDASDHVVDAALGNGLSISRDYNPYTERLNDGIIVNSTNTLVFHDNYQYDILGNVSNRAQEWGDGNHTSYSEAFTYDILNRLATSQVVGLDQLPNQGLQIFGYDSIGNILCKTGVGTLTGNCTSATAGNLGNGNYSYGAAASTNGNTGGGPTPSPASPASAAASATTPTATC